MITLSVSTDYLAAVTNAVQREHRLHELISISLVPAVEEDLCIDSHIKVLPDWKNLQPPIVFPGTAFSAEALLGLIFVKLGNFEKAFSYLDAYPQLLQPAIRLQCLQQDNMMDTKQLSLAAEEDYFALHNAAVVCQYGFFDQPIDFSLPRSLYALAVKAAPSGLYSAFTAKHYATLLLDAGWLQDAEMILRKELDKEYPAHVQAALKTGLCHVWMKKLTVPYDEALLTQLKNMLWECLQYYEAAGMKAEAALVLSDAAYIASISQSFSEALGYINKAIGFFEEEQQAELCAQAQFTRGNILQTWAQNGHPQFYRTAVQAYQQALRVFTRESAPAMFAELQHQLGKVYAEIPDEVKKKSVWAAVSVSSFNEALAYYNKIDFPYEFAMICNSLGNAYTKYPASLHTDNFDKALAWYREALDIRTAAAYPLERVLTLSNYVEASWFAGNKQDFDEDRYRDMMAKAQETVTLSQDAAISASARATIEKLLLLRREAIQDSH